MSLKKSADGPKITDKEAGKMDKKHASLKEDYLELQKEVRGLRKKMKKIRVKRERFEVEVRFLRSRKMMLTSKKSVEMTDTEAYPDDRLKMTCTDTRNVPLIEGLAIVEHEPSTHGSPHCLQLENSPHDSSVPERTAGLQSSKLVGIKPIVEPAPRKRRLESNGSLESSEPKGSKKKKIKGGQKKPIPPTNVGSENSFWDKK